MKGDASIVLPGRPVVVGPAVVCCWVVNLAVVCCWVVCLVVVCCWVVNLAVVCCCVVCLAVVCCWVVGAGVVCCWVVGLTVVLFWVVIGSVDGTKVWERRKTLDWYFLTRGIADHSLPNSYCLYRTCYCSSHWEWQFRSFGLFKNLKNCSLTPSLAKCTVDTSFLLNYWVRGGVGSTFPFYSDANFAFAQPLYQILLLTSNHLLPSVAVVGGKTRKTKPKEICLVTFKKE